MANSNPLRKPPNRLERARLKSKLSMAEAARRVGCGRSTYLRIERGIQTPRRELARRIFEQLRAGDSRLGLGAVYDPFYDEANGRTS